VVSRHEKGVRLRLQEEQEADAGRETLEQFRRGAWRRASLNQWLVLLLIALVIVAGIVRFVSDIASSL
jgi:hypothetical protein